MNKFTFWLIIFFTLLGVIGYIVYQAVVINNIPAIVFLSVTGTLLVLIIGHGLNQLSQRGLSGILRANMMTNAQENQDLMAQQMKLLNAMNQNALIKASHRMSINPNISIEPPAASLGLPGHQIFNIDDAAFDELE